MEYLRISDTFEAVYQRSSSKGIHVVFSTLNLINILILKHKCVTGRALLVVASLVLC